MTKPTDGYEKRLKRALEEGPNAMSVRQLAARLGGDKKRGIAGRYPDLRGTSYGGIRQYAEGKVRNPRIELLRAIAETVGVRPDWLAFERGGMTEEEDAALRERDGIARGGAQRDPRRVERERALLLKFEVLKGLGIDVPSLPAEPEGEEVETRMLWFVGRLNLGLIPHWVASIGEVRHRTGLDGQTIGRALRKLLTEVGLEPSEAINQQFALLPWLDDYIAAMVPVLLGLAPALKEK